MNTDMDSSNSDEYYVTALQIFDYCGAESSGTLRVDALMDKFAPFIKTNKEEYSYLKSLLDPEEENPAITVTKLATALHKYSESQKCKVDLDESFNLRCGQAPQDSDSGISTDGFQLLEDLQCELREKAHLAHQLRTQLDFTDRQHEEALATLTAERDTLTAHLNMLREENIALSHVRRDYEEACERLLGSERALGDARADLERVRRRARLLHDQAAALETDKASLQDLLAKSKDECHRMNEMYASRQSALLEHNEALRAERAELAARLRDQAERAQLLAKEKIILEMELKDVLNRSSQAPLPLDRSIEVSYTEDQMLTALDSLNADSRFSQETVSVSTQVETPCGECVKRRAPQRSLRRYFWEAVKCLFQVFAVLCFAMALGLLSGVWRGRGACRTPRAPTPWRWLHVQDLMDLLLPKVEYVAEVPM